ncbi:MAG: hypothetical protein WAO00_07805 [Chthoniobacterales bacterium]
MKQIITAVVIAILVGSSAPWWWSKIFPPKPPSHYELAGPIRVASVEHSEKSLGRYFHFYHSELDKALQREDWNDQKLWIVRGSTAKPRLIRVWRTPNGGTKGDSHGRYEDDPKGGDWSVGDEFSVAK